MKKAVTDTSKAAKKQGKTSRSPSKSSRKGDVKKGGPKEVDMEEDKNDHADDEHEEDKEEDDEEQSEMIINTSTKQKAQARKGRKSEILPQVGKKRLRGTKKVNLDDDNDEEKEFVEDDEGDGSDSKPSKKRKLAGGKVKVVKEKIKKAPKRPKEFKKGRWNPDVELVDIDREKEDPSKELIIGCCTRCNNRNIIRATITENEILLKNGIAATKKISNLIAYWSPECKWTSLEHIVSKNLHEFLEIMLHPKI